MHSRRILPLLAALFTAAACLLPCRADDIAEKGRAILAQNQRAVVAVEIVLKVTYSSAGQSSSPSETKLVIAGTVVDPSGLTVVPLSSCDPSETYQRLAPGQSRYKMDSEISDIKILQEDSTELPAEIVLRDKDLDLAFIRPKAKPSTPLATVDLEKSGPAQVLSEVITLCRLNNAAGRSAAARVERIAAVIQKPRLFYVGESSSAMGCPVFVPDGKLLGIYVVRTIASSSAADVRRYIVPIILPAEEILKAARQAPESKPGREDTKPATDQPKSH
jgi:hypothetical protein